MFASFKVVLHAIDYKGQNVHYKIYEGEEAISPASDLPKVVTADYDVLSADPNVFELRAELTLRR